MKTLLVLIFSFSLLFKTKAQSALIDMSAIEYVWKIIGKLEQGIKPSEEEWKAMFSTAGYSALGDWNNNNIRRNFEIVFSPSNKTALEQVLKTGNYWLKRDINHLIAVRERKAELLAYQRSINIEKVVYEAVKKAEVYLAKPVSRADAYQPVSFVVFAPDARAMDGRIIYDLLFAADNGEAKLINVLGHEFHHHYSSRALNNKFTFPDENSSFAPILNVISQLQGEGIADLIDKEYPPVILGRDTAAYHMIVNAQRQQSLKMKTLDSMLCVMSADTTGMTNMGTDAIRMFPGNAHYNGQYMAVVIKRQLGAEVIKKASCNPFLFFRLYQQACKKEKNEYVMSEKAIAFLNRMEKMFARAK